MKQPIFLLLRILLAIISTLVIISLVFPVLTGTAQPEQAKRHQAAGEDLYVLDFVYAQSFVPMAMSDAGDLKRWYDPTNQEYNQKQLVNSRRIISLIGFTRAVVLSEHNEIAHIRVTQGANKGEEGDILWYDIAKSEESTHGYGPGLTPLHPVPPGYHPFSYP